MSGVDQALWDIKGNRANMPVYQLLGGKTRMATDCYAHVSGSSFKEVKESVRRLMSEGFRHIRIQVGIPGMATYEAHSIPDPSSEVPNLPPPLAGPPQKIIYEPALYVRIVPKLFEYIRKKVSEELELLHGIHERISPDQAVYLGKELEQFRPFFVEDPFPPEQIGYFWHVRMQCADRSLWESCSIVHANLLVW